MDGNLKLPEDEADRKRTEVLMKSLDHHRAAVSKSLHELERSKLPVWFRPWHVRPPRA